MRMGSIRLLAGLVVLAAPAAWAERNIPAGIDSRSLFDTHLLHQVDDGARDQHAGRIR
jgi:hypothetical protein